jgi:fatty acid desaturase
MTLATWVAIVVVLGPFEVLRTAGLALLLGFMLVEPIMLSQHTHIPLRLAGDDDVRPFSPAAQVPFTRSLRFPGWISRLVLLHFDAHELHHAHPNVPGWRLSALEGTMPTPNAFPAFSWIARARRVPADVFLFSNRDRSGLDL